MANILRCGCWDKHLELRLKSQDSTERPSLGVLRRFQHCTGHITTGSWKGRGNQYIEFARVLYCKLLTNGKQLPAFPHNALTGIEPRPQRWEARVLPLCHHGLPQLYKDCVFFVSGCLLYEYRGQFHKGSQD